MLITACVLIVVLAAYMVLQDYRERTGLIMLDPRTLRPRIYR